MGEFEKKLRKAIVAKLNKVGFEMVSQTRKNLNVPQRYIQHGPYFKGLEPSQPGEFPRKLSGQLLKSIAFRVDKENLTVTVGTNLLYGRFLEFGTKIMKARPFLLRTFNNIREKIQKIFRG